MQTGQGRRGQDLAGLGSERQGRAGRAMMMSANLFRSFKWPATVWEDAALRQPHYCTSHPAPPLRRPANQIKLPFGNTFDLNDITYFRRQQLLARGPLPSALPLLRHIRNVHKVVSRGRDEGFGLDWKVIHREKYILNSRQRSPYTCLVTRKNCICEKHCITSR